MFPLTRSKWHLLLATAALGWACSPSEPPPEPLAQLPENKVHSASDCGRCHKSIHAAWKQSLHAAAVTDPLFQASFEEALEITDGAARQTCLRCHAPTALLSDDWQMEQAATRDGVSCDFCHSLTGNDFSQPDHPFVIDPSPTQHGPVRDAATLGHPVAFSEFFETSEHCAGCHEYTNPNGVALLQTYSEWETYAERGGDKSCQQCHMPQVAAQIVDPKIHRVEGGFVNLHAMPGGHSMDQLNRSIRLRIVELESTGQGLRAVVRVHNSGAGHAVPTGIPTRKVILSLRAVSEDDNSEVREERVFERIMVDAQGEEILRDSRVFLEAVEETLDTRLAPMEERLEEFDLDLTAQGNISVTATLSYYYSPLNEVETERRFDFMSDTRRLTRRIRE
ncbi:MAG TPA: multiheme c-type cytochrome [Acidobacteriota bacterium]|nr:multiheme c-type cytochrome [Acidobacteriota bacterium]